MVVGALAFVMTNPETIEFTRDMGDVGLAVIEYEDTEGALPQELALLGLSVPSLTDPWGHPYRYKITSDSDFGFDISSRGSDGEFGTDDNLVLSRIDRVWENAFDTFGGKMEELGTRLERLNQNGQYGQYGFNGHNDIVSASTFGCTKSKSKTRAEVYEQVAKALVVQEPLAEAVVDSDPASAPQPD